MKLDGFYLAGIAGIGQESEAQFSKPFLELTEPQREFIIESASTPSTVAGMDPAPAFFYFISRNDAIDVVYGTVKGFEKLKILYLPHIRPLSPW
jgi:gluconate 2-dehydrogenase subunit 3-like protein